MDVNTILVTAFTIIVFIMGYSVPLKLIMVLKKSNISTIPYREVIEEIATVWYLIIIVMFAFHVDYIYLAFVALFYFVSNITKHIYHVFTYKKRKNSVIFDVMFSTKKIKEHIENNYNNDSIQYIFGLNLQLKRIMLTNDKISDKSLLLDQLSKDKTIFVQDEINYSRYVFYYMLLLGGIIFYLSWITIYLYQAVLA